MSSPRVGRSTTLASQHPRATFLNSLSRFPQWRIFTGAGPGYPAPVPLLVPPSPSQFLTRLREDTLREIAANLNHLRDIWSLPLSERVEKGHSLGPLRVLSQRGGLVTLLHETDHSRESFSRLREGDWVRLTHDAPTANGPSAFFLQDDGQSIFLQMQDDGPLPAELPLRGLTIDPDFYDPTERFLAAVEALSSTEHGRKVVLPILMGEAENQTHPEIYDLVLDELEDRQDFHPSQEDAIALCLAASRFHLVQGPPGTGKTHVLAEVAARLVAQGHRVLLTGPTHRAIEHALQACRHRLDPPTPVTKISRNCLDPAPTFSHFKTLNDARLPPDEPFVLGATPHNLWSSASGLMDQQFDTVLLDEASQLTLILATLAMLRAEKFLFFGDHCQLPPVRLESKPKDPMEESVFNKLRSSSSATLLTESWRLNRDLAAWPSATFYGNQLVARHDRQLSLTPPSAHQALQGRPGFLALAHNEQNTSTRSPEEAETVLALLLDLLRGGLAPTEIAVVTPFRAQAALIRRLLRSRSDFSPWTVQDLVADTVERLQGQEREVIIVTLAASRAAFITRIEDFLFDPRRLNVALTRARRKTILLYSRSLHQVARSLAAAGSPGATTFCALLEQCPS